MKIAVIGSGISGLASAWLLARKHSVTLIEKQARVGGHTNTFVTGDGQCVDTGFIVFNQRCYPNLTALLRELDVPVQKARMSFGVSLGEGAYEWAGSDNLFTVFAQWSNLFNASHLRMLLELLRLNARCRELLARDELPAGLSLGQFLDREGFSQALRSRYLLPMAGLIWSCSPRRAADYPADDFMRFFDAHGLFTALSQPQWYSVRGGSHVYVKKLMAQFTGELGGALWLNADVTQLRREHGQVRVTGPGRSGQFDAVVCAAHADQALAMLGDASEAERQVLGGIPYTANRVVLHTDTTFLPRRRAAWASWNYQHPRDEIHDQPISGSYWMNLLQDIPGRKQYIVTLNPQREPAAGSVLYETSYDHPVYTAAARQTHARLAEIQGKNGIWWAGAWTGYGFHEDGLRSAVNVASALGCPPRWAAPVAVAESAGALYDVRVMHRRLVAPLYRFVYRLFYLMVDIDRLPELHRARRLFSHNRFNLVSLHERDYGDLSGAPGALRAWVEQMLAGGGIELHGGRIRLLTLPRVLGYVFNPISLYYCEHADGRLRAVVAEVRNTFGERHCYILGASGAAMAWDASVEKDKRFHVSPFFKMEGRYRFQISEPGRSVRIHIRETRDDAPLFEAALAGEQRCLSDAALLSRVLAMPWVMLKVVYAIHWEALKLWLRGARYVPKPPPPAHEAS